MKNQRRAKFPHFPTPFRGVPNVSNLRLLRAPPFPFSSSSIRTWFRGSPPVAVEGDPPTSDQAREGRRRVNDGRLSHVTGMFRQVSLPTPDAPIILLDAIDADVLALLRKGSTFPRFGHHRGNQ